MRQMLQFGSALLACALVAACASSRLHQQGLDAIEQGNYEAGLQKLAQAVNDSPGNLTYRLDLKGRHDEAVQRLIASADRARAAGDLDAAATAFQRVLSIESGNDRARNGLEGVAADRRHAELIARAQEEFKIGRLDQADALLHGVLAEDPGSGTAMQLRARIDSARGPVTVTPKLRTRDSRPVTLQFRDAPTKMVFEVLSRQTGINFIFDKDVRSDGKTTIFVQDVPVEQAIDLVLGQNQLARQILSDNLAMIYPNTQAKQKDYQDQIVRTFYLTSAAPKDVEGLLKTVLEAKTLVVNERANAIVIRDTPEVVRMAEKLVVSVDLPEPEVMLEVEVLEITRSRLQQLGIAYPTSATFATTPVGGTRMVVNDYAKQNGSTITATPLSITVDALAQTGVTNILASPRIRARNKEKAKILIGSREPVISSSATPTATGVVSSGSVQYLDVGLTLEVEPTIYADDDVSIKVNLEVSSLLKTIDVDTGNGGKTRAYEIGTRNAATLLQLKDGETQVLAGLIQDSDTRNASGIPGLGDIPMLGRLFSDHTTNKAKTEIVLSITPRIIRAKGRASSDNTEFWYGTESRTGMAPLGSMSGSATPLDAPATTPAATPIDVSSTGPPSTVTGPAAAQAASGATNAAQAAAVTATMQQHGTSQEPPPRPTLTLQGPDHVRAGEEFMVTADLQTDQGLNRLRAQVRFDASTLQLIGADPGGLVPDSLGAKVARVPGGAQLDVTAPADAPFSGSGTIMQLRFKALKAGPGTSIAAQLAVVGTDGTAVAATMPTPLTLAVAVAE
jgi:general secretion pathway protein D